MKRALLSLVALLALGAGYELIYPTSSKANIEKVQKTERQIAATVEEGKRIGEAISETTGQLDSKEGREVLTQEMAELQKNKHDLEHQTETLGRTLTALEAARTESWAAYQQHLDAMVGSDAWTKHKWAERGKTWYLAAGKIVNNGRALIGEAQGVTQQAASLGHVAEMLKIEKTMWTATGDTRTEIAQLQAAVGEFGKRSGNLLARISETTGAITAD